MKKGKSATIYALVSTILLVLAFNQYMIQSINANLVSNKLSASAESTKQDFMPKGSPAIYGTELGVSFDDALGSLNVLAMLDGDLYSDGKLKFSELSSAQQERYLKIGSSIACEFCCGANTLVFSDGQPACGCSHSAAMRGLAKHLLTNHGSEYTDQQILDELTKWKTVFFPKQMLARYASGKVSVGSHEEMVGAC